MPSLSSCGAEDGREWDAEDTPRASSGPSGLGCWVLLGAQPGNRSTIQRCSGGSTGGRQTLKSSKELRLISLPDQN